MMRLATGAPNATRSKQTGSEDRRAEDDPERGFCEIGARRLFGKLARDEFKITFDQREVVSGLIGLAQR
jgi:hypothetical protein